MEENKNLLPSNDAPMDDIAKLAKEKLEKEKCEAKDKSFTEAVVGHLLGRCEEDAGLAEDVMQQHKTWDKCYDYIYSKAKEQSVNNRAVVRYDVVYEWAEDYYRLNDKKEETEKAKAEKERKEKAEAKKAAEVERQEQETEKYSAKSKPVIAKENSKHGGKDIDGQMDLFSMLGI